MNCPHCDAPLIWNVSKGHSPGREVILWTKCPHCDGAGPWHREVLEVIWRPWPLDASSDPTHKF